MNKDIEKIIQVQQEYTYLQKFLREGVINKKCLIDKTVYSFAKTEHTVIVGKKLEASARKRKRKRTEKCVVIVLLLLILCLSLFCLSIVLIAEQQQPELDVMFVSYSSMAQTAIDEKDFETAHKLLDQALEEYPNGYAHYYVYANLYEAEGNYDDAVYILIKGLENCGGAESVTSTEHMIYKRLLNYQFPISQKARTDVDNVLNECEEWIIQNQLNSSVKSKP